MAYNSSNRSERLLQGRRFTTDNLTLSQEAFTDVFDLGASEIYTDDGLIPTGSTQLPFSGSSQNNLIVSASVVNPALAGTEDLPILKYHHKKKLKPAGDGQREVYYFTTSDPSAVDDGVTTDQVIEADQQTSFVSPKYIIASDASNITEGITPGYKVVVYKDTASSAGSITSDAADPSTYVFDFKTGVLTWISNAPTSNQFVYISVYQYIGRTLRSQIDDVSIIPDSYLQNSDTASFVTNSDTASFVTNSDTASFVTNSDTASFALTSNVVSNSSTSSFAILNQNVTFDNITALGDIIAENYIVSSSVTYMTQSFSSGSTIFGDDFSDTHQFSGSVFISGSSLQINGADVLTTSPFTPEGISGSFASQTGSFVTNSDTASFLVPADTASFLVPADTASFLVPSDTASFLVPADTASFLTQSPFTPTSISESLGTNATLIRSLTATSISESLGTNATLIRSLTATSISESLGTNATLIRSLTATGISGSFNGQTGSFVTNSDTASFAITSSDVKFSNITASGDISASGLLYISASETSATNYKILVQNSADGRIYTTGSVAGGGGISSFTNIASDVTPDGDGTRDLGSPTAKWEALYAQDTFFGGIHEINLETTGIGQLRTGTVLVSKAGQMVPCDTKGDALVMGVVTSGSDYPVIMGAEPVLVDGAVYEGDYIITSNRLGYGKAVPPDQIFEQRLFGKIIAQSLETNINGGVIKAMIRKM